MTPLEGYGTLITFQSSWLASIQDIGWSGIKRAAIRTSHMRTTATPVSTPSGQTAIPAGQAKHTFAPSSLADWGELKIKMFHDHDKRPPIDGAAETILLTSPVPAGMTTGATISGTGFMTDASVTIPLSDQWSQTEVTIKWSGDLTFTPSA